MARPEGGKRDADTGEAGETEAEMGRGGHHLSQPWTPSELAQAGDVPGASGGSTPVTPRLPTSGLQASRGGLVLSKGNGFLVVWCGGPGHCWA